MCVYMFSVHICIFSIQVLSKVDLNAQKKDIVVELLDKIILYHSTSGTNALGVKGAGLQKFCDLLNILYSKTPSEGYTDSNLKNEFAAKYKVSVKYLM